MMAAATGIQAAKRSLRKELKQRLSKLPVETKHSESLTITRKLLATTEYQKSERVSVYLSMSSEVNTMEILQNIFTARKQCFIPQYVGSVMKMVPLANMDDYDSLPVTSWNIKQPASDDVRDDALDTGGLDLIIVPGLGFTKHGARLGRGKGYYDSYINKCIRVGHARPTTIALAYSVQICEEIPITEHDKPIDIVLYPD